MKTFCSLLLIWTLSSLSFTTRPNFKPTTDNAPKTLDEGVRKYLIGNVVHYSALLKKIDKFGDETLDFINFGALGAECKFAQDGSKVTFVNGSGKQIKFTCKIEGNKLYLTNEKGEEKVYFVSLHSYGVKAIDVNSKDIKANSFGVMVGYIFHKNPSINFKD